jgi:hypothetical protein
VAVVAAVVAVLAGEVREVGAAVQEAQAAAVAEAWRTSPCMCPPRSR